MSKSKRWTWTMYDVDYVPTLSDDVDYVVWQTEKCPETERLHLQGYIRFKSRKMLSGVKRWFNSETVHCEVARGSEKDNRDYCTKSDSQVGGPWELGFYDGGVGARQGKRSDWDSLKKMIEDGHNFKDVAQKHTSLAIRYYAGIQNYIDTVSKDTEIEREIKCTVLWGPPGTGKTHRVRSLFGVSVFCVQPGRDPFGKYRDEKVILFDEFRWQSWTIQEMNTWCDKWTCRLDCRYCDRTAKWNRVFICSNIDPVQWWPGSSELEKQAFFRRVDIIEVKDKSQEININW